MRELFEILNKHEIDYRLESNFCCGFVFYFLDGSVYPRRYYDYALEGEEIQIVAESVDYMIEKSVSCELKKDWRHRIESEDFDDLLEQVKAHLKDNYNIKPE